MFFPTTALPLCVVCCCMPRGCGAWHRKCQKRNSSSTLVCKIHRKRKECKQFLAVLRFFTWLRRRAIVSFFSCSAQSTHSNFKKTLFYQCVQRYSAGKSRLFRCKRYFRKNDFEKNGGSTVKYAEAVGIRCYFAAWLKDRERAGIAYHGSI